MRTARILIPATAAVLALSVAAASHGQSLADRVARAEGDVRFSFTPKPGICGDGGATIYISENGTRRTVTISGNNFSTNINSRYADEWSPRCEEGPVRIALTANNGSVTSLRTYVGGDWRDRAGVTNLGLISGADAVNFLIGLAERSSSRVGRDAMFAATLADGAPDIWRRLMTIARNNDINRDVRKNAIFWLGQVSAQAATAGLRELIDSDEEVSIREQAIFSLSQRPDDESIPALTALIRRDNVDPRLKKQALFWLSQKNDPRVLALFEEILNKR